MVIIRAHPIGIVIALVGKDLRLEQHAKGRRESRDEYDEEDQHFHQSFQDTKKHDGINTKCAESTTDKHNTVVWSYTGTQLSDKTHIAKNKQDNVEVICVLASALKNRRSDT